MRDLLVGADTGTRTPASSRAFLIRATPADTPWGTCNFLPCAFPYAQDMVLSPATLHQPQKVISQCWKSPHQGQGHVGLDVYKHPMSHPALHSSLTRQEKAGANGGWLLHCVSQGGRVMNRWTHIPTFAQKACGRLGS